MKLYVSLVQDNDVGTNRLGSPQVPAKGLAGFLLFGDGDNGVTAAMLSRARVGADDLFWRMQGRASLLKFMSAWPADACLLFRPAMDVLCRI